MKIHFGKKDILTIPNLLSLFRILLIPQIVWLYAVAGKGYAALAAVAVSALTDVADGYIARHFHMVSELGKVLDPIADKLLVTAAMVMFVMWKWMPAWILIVVIAREFIVSALRMVAAANGKVIAAAITSQMGKARLPTHIELTGQSGGLSRDSVILLEQIRTIDKSRLREKMGRLDDATMSRVDNAISVSFGL